MRNTESIVNWLATRMSSPATPTMRTTDLFSRQESILSVGDHGVDGVYRRNVSVTSVSSQSGEV